MSSGSNATRSFAVGTATRLGGVALDGDSGHRVLLNGSSLRSGSAIGVSSSSIETGKLMLMMRIGREKAVRKRRQLSAKTETGPLVGVDERRAKTLAGVAEDRLKRAAPSTTEAAT